MTYWTNQDRFKSHMTRLTSAQRCCVTCMQMRGALFSHLHWEQNEQLSVAKQTVEPLQLHVFPINRKTQHLLESKVTLRAAPHAVFNGFCSIQAGKPRRYCIFKWRAFEFIYLTNTLILSICGRCKILTAIPPASKHLLHTFFGLQP